MTKMIPSIVHPAIRSAAERRLFETIQNAPGTEQWVCLHSLAVARHERKRKGEIDFLLLTRSGVFVLEVKGGRVAREGGAWIFIDRWGNQVKKYEGPFDQASGAMFSLEGDIRSTFGSDHRLARLLYGYGVLFPDIVFEEHGSESDPALVYDARDRSKAFTSYIDRLARFSREHDARSRYSPTENDIRQLVDHLRRDFDLVPPLGVRLDDVNVRLVELTQEQYLVLDAYESMTCPRLMIQGGAGTGKTLLAVECARREALKGHTTLFLCFNRLLAAYVSQVVQEHGLQDRIAVWPIFSFLMSLIKKASLEDEFKKQSQGQSDEFIYKNLFPEYGALAALHDGTSQFDVIVVDEGQDFIRQSILTVLDAVLKNGLSGGCWRVFTDVNNQGAVYGSYEEIALMELRQLGHSSVLTLNRRNSKEVARETAMLAVPRVPTRAVTPGLPVEYIWFNSPTEQPKRLSDLLYRLYEDGVAPGRVTVLSPRSGPQSCPSLLRDPQLVPVTENNIYSVVGSRCDTTTFSTISAFKGLENDYIILADINDLGNDWWRSILYVGMSRARAGLCLIMPNSLRPVYEACLRESMHSLLREPEQQGGSRG